MAGFKEMFEEGVMASEAGESLSARVDGQDARMDTMIDALTSALKAVETMADSVSRLTAVMSVEVQDTGKGNGDGIV